MNEQKKPIPKPEKPPAPEITESPLELEEQERELLASQIQASRLYE